MSLRINYNFQAEFTHVNLVKTERNLNTSLERLSTGYRINSAKDDAAGLFIADQLRLVSQALNQGSRNAQDGISAAQIAESSLSQIYDKLTSIYTKAEQAASDTNDPNARLALQRDIQKLVDAIDKISSTAEFNGLKLLDGTFKNKVIHFGARADQTLTMSIDSARAKDLGAYVIDAPGSITNNATAGYTVLITSNFAYTTGDSFSIAGVDLTGSLTSGTPVDAKAVADAINNNATLADLGITATAQNKSVASNEFQNITVTSALTFKFYIGTDTANPITISYGAGDVVTLDDLVNRINTAASAAGSSLRATAVDNKLVLETDGETIGVEVDNDTGAAIDLSTIIDTGGATVSVADNGIGSGMKVGELSVTGASAYSYNFTGISADGEGLGIAASGNGLMYNLNALDVTDSASAELAMKIIDVTIKKVDSMRSALGSIQINLQAIIDNNDFAATQTSEAESRIRNVDFAKEMANFTKQQTLMQSGMAMLAQANQLPQMVLQLLR